MKPIALFAVVALCGCTSMHWHSQTPEAISAHLAKTGVDWARLHTTHAIPDEFLGDIQPHFVFRSSAGVIRAYEYSESEGYRHFEYREYDPANPVHAGGGSITPKNGNTSNKSQEGIGEELAKPSE